MRNSEPVVKLLELYGYVGIIERRKCRLTIIEEKVSVEEEMDLQPNKMKRLPRGRFKPKKSATDLENCKVKISMYVDADVLQYFRVHGEKEHAAPYQTQINNKLRRIM